MHLALDLRLFFALTALATLHHTLILYCLVFGLMPFDWLRSWTLPKEYESHGAE